MAKRGYRGPHPYNDTKAETASSTKYSSKIKKQYDKLKNNKQKYDFIRTNYFHPQATMTISGTLDLVAASAITMSAADGTTLSIKGAGSTNTGATPPTFKHNGTAANASDGIADCVNANLANKMSASVSSGVVTLTQEQPGPDGNSTINVGSGTIVQTVAFNGTAANNSGSGFLFTGG